MNIFDYVKYYGGKSFMEIPLTEVDAVIFSCLTYLNFDGIIKKLPITINELAVNYFVRVTPENFKNQVNTGKLYTDCYKLLYEIKNTIRYKDIYIYDYKKFVDNETQFGALSFKAKDFMFIAFEGTNNYISGWKEDFNMSYQFPVYSQILARNFIEDNVNLLDNKIYLGGHSKGGNLAIVGSMLANNSIKKKIKLIYDFDGPGVSEKEFNSVEYNLIKNKIRKYVPKESMVGMLMNSPTDYKIIKSSSIVILQHNPFTWKCYGNFFIEDKISKKSLIFKKDMEEFLNYYPKESMEELVNVVFNIFKEVKIEKTRGVSLKQIAQSTKYIREMKANKETKEKLNKLISIIINYINN